MSTKFDQKRTKKKERRLVSWCARHLKKGQFRGSYVINWVLTTFLIPEPVIKLGIRRLSVERKDEKKCRFFLGIVAS